MATRIYARGSVAGSLNPRQLAASIDTALARTGHVCDIEGLAIFVTHTALSATNDTIIQNTINAYVFNPNFDLPSHEVSLQGVITILNGWAVDAQNAVNAWDTQNTAQRFAALKIVVNRFGLMASRLGDILKVLDRGN
jgi:hypothetical protein